MATNHEVGSSNLSERELPQTLLRDCFDMHWPLQFWYVSIPVALMPNLLCLLPIKRKAQKLGVNPTPWMLGAMVFLPLAAANFAKDYSPEESKQTNFKKLFITSFIVCSLFWLAAIFIEVSL